MEERKNITKAIIAVMKKVEGIDKSMTVGSGANAYKGVPDQDVKKVIGKAMAEYGLCIVPVSVTASTRVDRWEESTQYGVKQKQAVLVEATTKYLLLHESGESIELTGYGHGTDTQDKAAGKATTYALKYTLLYTFLVPTGKIDDSDNHHSDEYNVPAKQPAKKQPAKQLVDAMEVLNAIAKVNAAATTEELKALKASLPAYIVTDASFIAAGKERYNVIMAAAPKPESITT